MVRVAIGSMSVSSPRIPISEVNKPSVLLEPVSLGFLISGFDIFMRFVGGSMFREMADGHVKWTAPAKNSKC